MDEAKLQEILDDAAERLALGRYSNADAAVHSLVAEVRRLTAALDAARREGAEGMRAAVLAECRAEEMRGHEDRAAVVDTPGRQLADLARHEGRALAANALWLTIRALPLDAPGGGS